MMPSASASSQCGFGAKSNARFAPYSATTTLPLSSGRDRDMRPAACSAPASSSAWSWASTAFTSSSSPPMRSPSSRMRTISASRCAASLVRPTSFEPWLSSALSASTSVSRARRRSSQRHDLVERRLRVRGRDRGFDAFGSSRISRRSSIAAPSTPGSHVPGHKRAPRSGGALHRHSVSTENRDQRAARLAPRPFNDATEIGVNPGKNFDHSWVTAPSIRRSMV